MDEASDFEREPLDVTRIMAEIRRSIAKERERGIYTDEDVEELVEARLRACAAEAEIDPRVLERLLWPSHDWNIAIDYEVRTRRSGLPARLVILAKKIVRPFVRLYTDQVLGRQAQLNLYAIHLLHRSAHDIARLQLEVAALRKRCDAMDERGSPPRPRVDA